MQKAAAYRKIFERLRPPKLLFYLENIPIFVKLCFLC